MADRNQLVVKKPEAKRDNSVIKSRKTDYPQSKWSPANQVIFLQRTIGNQAVQRLINSGVLQAKLKVGQLGGSSEISGDFENRLHSARGRGVPLPDQLRNEFEPKFGADFSAVQIHTGTESAELNQEVQAKAFTNGSDIHFDEGQYDPGSTVGKELLAHELTHVVQQDAVKRDNSVRFRPALVQGNVSHVIQRAIQIPAAVVAALSTAGRFLLSCIIGAAFGVGLDYAIQRGVAWWRNQSFRWNTCSAWISGIIGCVSGGVSGAISRALFRSTGGHLEKDFALKVVVWLITWLYGKFPVWPIAAILKQLVNLGCADASELPPGVQAE
jgi:hypothetical protein